MFEDNIADLPAPAIKFGFPAGQSPFTKTINYISALRRRVGSYDRKTLNKKYRTAIKLGLDIIKPTKLNVSRAILEKNYIEYKLELFRRNIAYEFGMQQLAARKQIKKISKAVDSEITRLGPKFDKYVKRGARVYKGKPAKKVVKPTKPGEKINQVPDEIVTFSPHGEFAIRIDYSVRVVESDQRDANGNKFPPTEIPNISTHELQEIMNDYDMPSDSYFVIKYSLAVKESDAKGKIDWNQPVSHQELERWVPKAGENTLTAKNITTAINIIRYYYQTPQLIYVLWDKIRNVPSDFKLFDGETNCVIKCIKEGKVGKKWSEKQLEKIDYVASTITDGFQAKQAALLAIGAKTKIFVRVMLPNASTWYDPATEWEERQTAKRAAKGLLPLKEQRALAAVAAGKPPPKKQSKTSGAAVISVLAVNGHATLFKGIETPTKVVYVQRNQQGTEMLLEYRTRHADPTPDCGRPMMLFGGTKVDKYKMLAFRYHDTIVKSFKPECVEDQQNPKYFECVSELSYAFKKWRTENSLGPATGEYYEFMKSCDHFLTSQQFQPFIPGKDYPLHDQCEAFPSFKTNPLYAEYLLPVGGFQMLDCTDQQRALEIIMTTCGFSVISDIVITHPLIEKIQWIQNGRGYANPQLRFILENNLATFKVVSVCLAISADIDMPFKQAFGVSDMTRKINKQFNNSFIGKMIAGRSQPNITEQYAGNPVEIAQMLFLAKKSTDYAGSEIIKDPFSIGDENEQILVIHKRVEEAKNSLFHIHAFIMAYQQISFVAAMMKTPLDNIICFNTDGFHVVEELPADVLERSLEPGKFKLENKPIEFTPCQVPRIQTPATMDGGVLLDRWVNSEGLLIPGCDRVLINGPPGCGKSMRATAYPLKGSCIKVATHLLRAMTEAQVGGKITAGTVQKLLGSHSDIMEHETIIVDEVTMITRFQKRDIERLCDKLHKRLIFIGDIDELGTHQLEPPEVLNGIQQIPLEWKDFAGYTVTTDILPVRRQNAEESLFIDSLRGLDHAHQMELIKQHPVLSTRFITPEQMYAAYANEVIAEEVDFCGIKQHAGTINASGVVAVHRRAQEFNEELLARCKLQKIRAVNSRHAGIVKGQIITHSVLGAVFSVWGGRTSADDCELTPEDIEAKKKPSDFELGYFNSCDAVQGCSITHKLFIDLERADKRKNYLYTALTRCKSVDGASALANVYFVVA